MGTDSLTSRGFTGHEMLDEVGIIHMNGRIYDAKLGRFLQADPIIQDPFDTQSLNRYSYTINNPLNATDPSGFSFFKKLFKFVIAAVAVYFTAGWAAGAYTTAATNAAIAAGTFGQTAFMAITFNAGIIGGLAGGFVGGALAAAAGGSIGDIIKGGLIGAISGGAFGAIGGSSLKFGTKALGHGLTGGITSKLQGGKFGHGFFSAGLTKLANVNNLVGYGAEKAGLRVGLAAIIGGTISKVTGGKFGNGAATGAVGQLLNGERDPRNRKAAQPKQNFAITFAQRKLAAEGKVEEFWKSRQAVGDPVAEAGLASLNPSDGPKDYLFGGTSINNRLQAFANVYADGVLNIDQVRAELMNAHIRFTDRDTSGISGLLNPGQIAKYHHQVFDRHNLPPTAFGGTPFTGAVGEAWYTAPIWCGGCDRQ